MECHTLYRFLKMNKWTFFSRGSQPCPHAKIVGRRIFKVGRRGFFQKNHYRGSDFFGKITTKFSKKFTTAVNNIQNIIMLKNFIFSVVFFFFWKFCFVVVIFWLDEKFGSDFWHYKKRLRTHGSLCILNIPLLNNIQTSSKSCSYQAMAY